MSLLECLELDPPKEPATSSVIWMHGLGADATDFVPVAPHLHLPQTRFVFPNAPRQPVTINGGMVMRSWYDIRTFERVPDRENGDHIRASRDAIEALIAREVERGVPHERIVLAGFSQGAAMTLFTGLRHAHRLAGLVVLSGYLVLEDTLTAEAHEANKGTPIFFGHGTHDDVVVLSKGKAAYEAVKDGRQATWKTYPMPHSVSMPEIADIRAWIQPILG